MGRPPKLTPHQKREAIKRRDTGDETLADIGRSYNVSPATIFATDGTIMQSYFFPCVGLVPDFQEPAVTAGRFTVHRRLGETTTFDVATLASRHRLHLPWQLMDVFLSKADCEIEVRCQEGYEASREGSSRCPR